jgi:hypothetical protein
MKSQTSTMKNNKPLRNEIEDIRKCKDLPCSCIGRINIVKMAMLPKAILIKIPVTFFSEYVCVRACVCVCVCVEKERERDRDGEY